MRRIDCVSRWKARLLPGTITAGLIAPGHGNPSENESTPRERTPDMAWPTPPFSYRDSEGTDREYHSVDGLQADVEFVDDQDDYLCLDAAGHRIRLVVWCMEALLVQRIPDDFSPLGLVLCRQRSAVSDVWVEMFDDQPLRALVRGTARWDIMPVEEVEVGTALVPHDGMTAGEFAEIWLKAATRRAPRKPGVLRRLFG